MGFSTQSTLAQSTVEQSQRLARALKLHPLVARVLVGRGLSDPDVAREYLSPKLSALTLPDKMADRDLAAERLARAVEQHERVVVFGDYDVDGITAAALLTRTLRSLGCEVSALVASRFDGGYGLSDRALDRVMALKPKVLVTCDCGTSDHPRLARARDAGVDCIVVDHHKVPDEPLPAVAFLNPHRAECGFGYKHLASVGLAFSISAAVRTRLSRSLDLRPMLDLVALGTIADVAPLDGDNRIFVRAGLDRIGDGHVCPGLSALLKHIRLRFRPSARDVGFSIAPLLNAPGRLGDATPTLELLLTDDHAESLRLAAVLAEANLRRREISQNLVEKALSQVRELYGTETPSGIVVAGEGWHEGMGGIVAGRLVDRLGAAAAVIAVNHGLGVGSVRAPRNVKVYDALCDCADVLETFGGHDAAAGLRVRSEKLELFRSRFAMAVTENLRHEVTAGPVVETRLTQEDFMGTLARDLRAFEPTGEGNPGPFVEVAEATVANLRVVGETNLVVSLKLGAQPLTGFLRDGVRLQREGRLPRLADRVSAVGTLRPDPWNGDEAVQLELHVLNPIG